MSNGKFLWAETDGAIGGIQTITCGRFSVFSYEADAREFVLYRRNTKFETKEDTDNSQMQSRQYTY